MNITVKKEMPLVAILLAVYEPRMDWLEEQLLSLNAQVYENIRLYIRDDCSPVVPYETIQSCVQKCICKFPYKINRNEKNLGSNKTFERLTEEAEGDCFVYCDQDDVWLPEKIAHLVDAMMLHNCTMVYCDVSIIDENGRQTAESLRDIRPRLDYLQGEGLAEQFFFRNCTAGCSMLINATVAKEAVPFPRKTVCDQWMAICAAGVGKIGFVDMPLIRYRQHGNNQTGILHGVTDKESYYNLRVLPLEERKEFFERKFEMSRDAAFFISGRCNRNVAQIWKYRRFAKYEALFEIVMHLMPSELVKWLLRRLK